MGKETKESKGGKSEKEQKSRNAYVQGKKKIMVPIFSDEFKQFEIVDSMSTFEAQCKVRDVLELPRRQKAITSVRSRLRDTVKDMTDEELEKFLDELSAKHLKR